MRDRPFLKSLRSLISRPQAGPSGPALATARPDPVHVMQRLAGGVAHDFNNLMLVVRGYVELALGEEDLGPQARSHLQEVMTALQRATELIGQLLSVGHRPSSSMTEIDVNESVGRALDQCRASRAGGLAASFIPGDSLPHLLASADQVERLVANLIQYATERMGQDDRLSIETRLEPGGQSSAERITLLISAPGAIVPEDERMHLFEPFYVSPATGRRIGLAMAAAQGTVGLLGGQISAGFPGSGGIEFLVKLPVRTENRSVPTPARRGTILLAEDDATVRGLASRVLAKEGYRVLTARDGEEAALLFDQNKEDICIAILDDVMPKLSGRTVLGRIRETCPTLPVVLCAGYTWGVQESVPRSEREEILPKPYEPRDLLRCVRRLLGNGA